MNQNSKQKKNENDEEMRKKNVLEEEENIKLYFVFKYFILANKVFFFFTITFFLPSPSIHLRFLLLQIILLLQLLSAFFVCVLKLFIYNFTIPSFVFRRLQHFFYLLFLFYLTISYLF